MKTLLSVGILKKQLYDSHSHNIQQLGLTIPSIMFRSKLIGQQVVDIF